MPQFSSLNKTNTTLQVHHHTPAEWSEKNHVLAAGEYGLEDGTFLLKIGDGVTPWNRLRYLNKLDARYFSYQSDGSVTFSDDFLAVVDDYVQKSNAVVPKLTITNNPIDPTDAVTKIYVDKAIADAGILRHQFVLELPSVENADPNTVYMIKNSDNEYDQYILVDGEFQTLGAISFELQPATLTTLGGVRGSKADNHVFVNSQGFMTLNRVSTSLLYVPDGDTFSIYGGTAQEV